MPEDSYVYVQCSWDWIPAFAGMTRGRTKTVYRVQLLNFHCASQARLTGSTSFIKKNLNQKYPGH